MSNNSLSEKNKIVFNGKELELKTLRDLKERTKIANSRKDTNL